MGTTLAYVIQLLGVVPQLIEAGSDIVSQWKEHQELAAKMESEKRDPTPAEWQALNDYIAPLRAELHS